MEFLINYVSIWEKKWFLGLCRLLIDVISIGAVLLFVFLIICSIIVWLSE